MTLSAEVRAELPFPGVAIPMYDPSAPPLKSLRRPWHDTFRPPHGPPVFFPVSIGYGAEVGIEAGLQALWDPNGQMYFFADHIRQVTFYEDPRLPLEPPPIVQKQQHAYGDRCCQASLPNACCDALVIEFIAK